MTPEQCPTEPARAINPEERQALLDALLRLHTPNESEAQPSKWLWKTLGISAATGWRWLASGRIGPRPLRFGRTLRWRASEVRNWINSGCPRREAWEARQRAGGSR